LLLQGDLGSRKGALTAGYVDLNKNRLRAHRQQVAAQEAWKKGQDGAPSNQLQGTDYQSATNLMGELQHMEAKQANFNHMISKNEAKIDRIAS
jgi:hypothetical protein